MSSRGPGPWSLRRAQRFQRGWPKSHWRCATSLCLKTHEKTVYNWFKGEVVEEGNADDTDDEDDDDYDKMENLVDNVLGDDDNKDNDD